MENFYNLLTRRDAAENSFPERFFFDPRHESSGDLKVYIRFNQRQTHLAQCSVDVGFADNAVSTQVFENFLKLVAELLKHDAKGVAPSGAVPSAWQLESRRFWKKRLSFWRCYGLWRCYSLWCCCPSGRAFLNSKCPVCFDFFPLRL